jgi:DNA-binding CsgD family transcriptional regulator
MWLAALRGDEARVSALNDALIEEATAGGQGRRIEFARHHRALLCNGLGHYEAALEAARPAMERDTIAYGTFIVPELAEAASRTGDDRLLADALDWMSVRIRATPTEWAHGMAARVGALHSEDDAADGLYRESIERLGRTPLRPEVARGHLLYGEWLRRQGHRVDARTQLHTAHDMLATMGLHAFAERARRELLATGETVHKRNVESRYELTPQEAQIARLAREGYRNSEIAAQLFISTRTVEWHLRQIFTKLDITSRRQLRDALPGSEHAVSLPTAVGREAPKFSQPRRGLADPGRDERRSSDRR